MSVLDDIAEWELDVDGRTIPIRDLPDEMQAVLAIEALAYGVIAALPFAERAAIGRHLHDIADLLQSIDPLQHRRAPEQAWAAHVAGHA